jgi:hypothetical protein
VWRGIGWAFSKGEIDEAVFDAIALVEEDAAEMAYQANTARATAAALARGRR